MAVNSVTTSNVRSYNGIPTADGVDLGGGILGKVGFFGTTPVIQQATASQDAIVGTAVTAGTTTVSTTTVPEGFQTGTQVATLLTRVAQLQVDVAANIILTNQIRADLVLHGLIKGSV